MIFTVNDKTEFDHRPSLILRPVNADGTDYDPPQNDPNFLQELHSPCHLKRTVGRLPGAERTVTTKGSDAHLAAKFRKLEKPRKPRTVIQPRGFPNAKRKIPSRKFSERNHK
jgi:hypothetical protein